MPETPDFKLIADDLLGRFLPAGLSPSASMTTVRNAITEQLRLIWNARGAADLAKLEAELSSQMGVTASGPYVKNLDRALRTLDR